MSKFVWFNPYLPQTLQISVVLAYFSAGYSVAALVLGPILPFFASGLSPIEFVILAVGVLGAFGIANLRWWGYILALCVAFFPFVLGLLGTFIFGYTIFEYLGAIFSGPYLISTIFNIAIVALLVHPMSRQYVKSNFEKTIP